MANVFRSCWPSIIALVCLSFAATFCFVHATAERVRLSMSFRFIEAFPVEYAARFLQRDWLAILVNTRSEPAFARTMAFAKRILGRHSERRHGAALNYGVAGASL